MSNYWKKFDKYGNDKIKPCLANSSNYMSYILAITESTAIFESTKKGTIALVLLGILFCVPIVFFFNEYLNSTISFKTMLIIAGIFSLLIWFGYKLRIYTTRPKIFDKTRGLYRNGAKQISFDEISHIQVIGYWSKTSMTNSSSSSRYRLSQINLVLKNAERVNVVAHTVSELLESEAGNLAEFLGIQCECLKENSPYSESIQAKKAA